MNFDELFRLVDVLNTNAPTYETEVLAEVDMETWMATFAMNDLAAFWDGFGNPNDKNTYLYKPEQGRWGLVSWDFDVGLGVFNDPWDSELFGACVDPTVVRLYNHPPFVRHYWRTLIESVHGFFQASELTPLLAEKYQAYVDAGLTITSPFVPSGTGLSITDWIDLRRDYILDQIALVDAPFTASGPASSSVSLVTLTGSAPLAIKTLHVNDAPLMVSWTNTTSWAGVFVLQPGTNLVEVQRLNGSDEVVTNVQLQIVYTGSVTWPPLRINE
ncbi:MAG: hypothetical protein ACI9QL_004209 [Candidatus Omnitrophota bacterium]